MKLSLSETPALKNKLLWNPPKGRPCLEVSHLVYPKFTKEERTAVRT